MLLRERGSCRGLVQPKGWALGNTSGSMADVPQFAGLKDSRSEKLTNMDDRTG